MKPIQTPSPLPDPVTMHSGASSGTTIMCAGDVLRVLSVGNLAWRKVKPGWYQLTPEEHEDWSHWACWTAGYCQFGGLSWPDKQTEPVPA